MSVVVNLRLAMYDRPYARRRRRPRTNYALTSTRWDFFVVGFSKLTAIKLFAQSLNSVKN